MKPERILLPVDIHCCPLEVFELVNGFAKRPEVTVILLHVINLNIVSYDNRVYEELSLESQFFLQRLADKYIHPLASRVVRVRTGKPAEQILVEAKVQNAELIILPTYGPSFWKRVTARWSPASRPVLSALAEKVRREALCQVFLVSANTRFNCERSWGLPEGKSTNLCKTRSPMISPAH